MGLEPFGFFFIVGYIFYHFTWYIPACAQNFVMNRLTPHERDLLFQQIADRITSEANARATRAASADLARQRQRNRPIRAPTRAESARRARQGQELVAQAAARSSSMPPRLINTADMCVV